MIRHIIMFWGWLTIAISYGQFPPPVGQPGTTAIHKDSNIFVAWAQSITIARGWQNITDHSQGKASAGDSTYALGKADGSTVSLGDSGYAIAYFPDPIFNGPGWDFAVFENAFNDSFLELAFVEVSSDGINFFRFPATSLTQDTQQIGTFGSVDATKINNLAGKYRIMYGTPFDLEELNNIPGLDINHISHIKIIDVVGNIQPPYASYDTAGHAINDPWPTPFPTSGFDLDAIGVIHQITSTKESLLSGITFYPNPAKDILYLKNTNNAPYLMISLYDITGKQIEQYTFITPPHTLAIPLHSLKHGIYFIQINGQTEKLVIE